MTGPKTLRWRILAATLSTLIGILLLAGLALDKAFQRVARSNMHEQLENLTYALLASTEIASDGQIVIPPQLPQSKINTPDSGRYAVIIDETGQAIWRSPSSLGETLPTINPMNPGYAHFQANKGDTEKPFVFRFGSVWGQPNGEDVRLTFAFVQDKAQYLTEIRGYRETLIQWLGGGIILLVLLHVWVLMRELRPLRRVVQEVQRVEKGDSLSIKGEYPSELALLSQHINAFIKNERAQTDSYRHAVDDLAHSLKTPIAVIRGMDLSPENNEQHRLLAEQVDRISEIIDYQLKRAAAAGKITMGGKQTLVQPIAKKILASLHKVYSDKVVNSDLNCTPDASFPGDKDDLFEILGNLADNAFKWCKSRVTIDIGIQTNRRNQPELVMRVSDDGPGIAEEMKKEITHRGVRGDHQTPGQGIGLAVIQAIVRAHNGELMIGTSELGGAKITIVI